MSKIVIDNKTHKIIILHLSMDVANGTDELETHVPLNGTKLYLLEFQAAGRLSSDSPVRALWNQGHGSETAENLWEFADSGIIKNIDINELTSNNPDGTRKVALCLSNGAADDAFMSGLIILKEI